MRVPLSRAVGVLIVVVSSFVLCGRWGWELEPFGSSERDDSDSRCAPRTVRYRDFVRVDRIAEARQALKLAAGLRDEGLPADVAGIYEFEIFPDNPTLFFVLGAGEASAEALRDHAVEAFGGVRRKDHSTLDKEASGVRYTCSEFAIGRGMVSMSVACGFSGVDASGYIVRTAGASLPMDFDVVPELREKVVRAAVARQFACTDLAEMTAKAERPLDVTGLATEFAAAMRGYGCRRALELFSDGAEAFFHQHVTAELVGDSRGPVDRVCHVLSLMEFPPEDGLKVKVVDESSGHAVVELSAWGHGKRPRVALIREREQWRVDATWALRQVQDTTARHKVVWETMGVGNNGTVEKGRADGDSPPGQLYESHSPNGARCLSIRSHSGELFMVRSVTSHDWTGMRGTSLPTCPDEPFAGHL